MTIHSEIEKAANDRRKRRWAKEQASRNEEAAHRTLVGLVAKWKKVKPEQLKFSNIMCSKAPADMNCVFIARFNKFANPCLFCGGWEEDVF